MYSIFADPDLATQIAKQQIDEWVRDADVRRTVREVRRAARAHRAADSNPRRAARASAATTRTLTSDGT
jgi:hypothetical protein